MEGNGGNASKDHFDLSYSLCYVFKLVMKPNFLTLVLRLKYYKTSKKSEQAISRYDRSAVSEATSNVAFYFSPLGIQYYSF